MVPNIFYFHPNLGKWSNLTNIFQTGWNHQLVKNILLVLKFFFVVPLTPGVYWHTPQVASEAGELKAQAGACDSSGRLEGMVVFLDVFFHFGRQNAITWSVFLCFFSPLKVLCCHTLRFLWQGHQTYWFFGSWNQREPVGSLGKVLPIQVGELLHPNSPQMIPKMFVPLLWLSNLPTC